jgi:hypothetical protein
VRSPVGVDLGRGSLGDSGVLDVEVLLELDQVLKEEEKQTRKCARSAAEEEFHAE